MKKQFESKFLHYALAFKYNLNLIFYWRAEWDRKFFGFWHLKHAGKWVLGNYWRQIIFFTVPLSKIIFLCQNQSKDIFFEKNPSPPPPPEYQMDRALALWTELFIFAVLMSDDYGVFASILALILGRLTKFNRFCIYCNLTSTRSCIFVWHVTPCSPPESIIEG